LIIGKQQNQMKSVIAERSAKREVMMKKRKTRKTEATNVCHEYKCWDRANCEGKIEKV
jgi:hypothetical protein